MSQIFNKLINTLYYFTCHKFMSTSLVVRNMATVKRFYRRTNILSSGDKFEVTLDQRKLKTPQGRIFEVNNKPLALAVAAEWDAQKETIDRGSMHLTSLCNTVLDNPYNRTKIDLVNHMVNCLEMDTILFYSSEVDELYQLQIEKWEPIVHWFCEDYNVEIMRTQSIQTPTVSIETKAALTRHLLSYNFNSIYGLVYAMDGLKSVILTLATAARVINIPEAVSLSRLEEEHQISHWGNVEWHHEYGKQDLQARLSAAMLFVYLNSHSATSRPKNDVSNVS
ncbi:PREDICTED: ATP synthase mitochondrial F1 complex assembly factor 2 [Atta cephalotes]|uniref:ATP synthase mitochondrial F1 complex assembly factor 2 n=2 Tax=Atta TaxID=12956 RepID=A0A158ND89_ATTCE|nr:PREDICTED: ATP synthase mitochondrial F1 complex assembly factor 2 [Atta cephalotes]XP_018054426.1 PREDICTED: ATP synthase mitochondrial F1 complex assembly factor 2 [Atta colombica]KYM78051.1 ATP synthase mitochondrial F1 complex assembly factor 2 [Atta colombica]